MDFLKDIDAAMDAIEYGWVDESGNRHEDLAGFSDNYRLQSPGQLSESHLGVCWDQVELARKLFNDAGVKNRTFFIVHYDGDKCPTHTFILFEHDGKTYWHEHAWEIMRGLHEFNTFEQAISTIRDAFIENMLHGEYDPQNLVIYEYGAAPAGLSCLEFYKHCEKGKQVLSF